MKQFLYMALVSVLAVVSIDTDAQSYKTDRLSKAAEVLGLQVPVDSLMPEQTIELKAKDGRPVALRTDPMGEIEHIGAPLFDDIMRVLQPSPVYDFLEYAVLNWKYKINPNQLYLSKVIFKQGSWETLLNVKLRECECSIENRDDKLYVVTWEQDGKNVVAIGIPIEYELLNNDTRRNMEKTFLRALSASNAAIPRQSPTIVCEDSLSIYGTEGLFVMPGDSYIINLLNQNVYYKLTTVYKTESTNVGNEPAVMAMETVQPVVVNDPEFPAETFANLMMCNDTSVPDVIMDLDFHLSDYHRKQVTMPLSQLKAFCRQQGCKFYFACDGIRDGVVRAVTFASNLSKGYNHLFSLRIPAEQLTSQSPTVHGDVYLYIPPIEKSKLFGTAPTKKSGVNFKLP